MEEVRTDKVKSGKTMSFVMDKDAPTRHMKGGE